MACCSADVVAYAMRFLPCGTELLLGVLVVGPLEDLDASMHDRSIWRFYMLASLSSHSTFDGLADGRERFSDSLNFDLMSIAVVTCPDPCSEYWL